jgi:hypothetical protein
MRAKLAKGLLVCALSALKDYLFMRAKRAKGLLVCARSAQAAVRRRGWCDEMVSQRICQEFGEVVNDMFFIECGLLFRNFQLIDLLHLITC